VKTESGRKPDPSGVYKVAVCLTRHNVAPWSPRHSFDLDDEQEHSVVTAAAETTTTNRKPARVALTQPLVPQRAETVQNEATPRRSCASVGSAPPARP